MSEQPTTAANRTITLTLADLKELIAEFKKPTPEEQEKIDREKALKLRALKQRQESAAIEMAAKKQREDGCNHKKEKGESAVFGQVHTDGMFHPICVRCQKEFPPYKARPEQV